MTVKKRGLAKGRGLDALLGTIQKEKLQLETQNITHGELIQLDVTLLQRGEYQPRGQIRDEDVEELAQSIKKHGVMQPIVVRPLGESGRYEIIAGERRWRASKVAGLTHIPAIVRVLSDQVAIALALIENIQRQDLNPMEQALALQRFHDEFEMSHQEIAETVGKARTTVSNFLRLLTLHNDVKQMILNNALDMGHARAILSLKVEDQPKVSKIVQDKQLSVRQTEQLVKTFYDEKNKNISPVLPDIEQLTLRLVEHFNADIQLDHHQKGKGKLVIHYHSLDELDGILRRCGVDINQD